MPHPSLPVEDPGADIDVPVAEEAPEFTVVLRGYDREQVDQYVQYLMLELAECRARADAAERRLTSPGRSWPAAPALSGSEPGELPEQLELLGRHVTRLQQERRTAQAQLHALARQLDALVQEHEPPAMIDLRTAAEVTQ